MTSTKPASLFYSSLILHFSIPTFNPFPILHKYTPTLHISFIFCIRKCNIASKQNVILNINPRLNNWEVHRCIQKISINFPPDSPLRYFHECLRLDETDKTKSESKNLVSFFSTVFNFLIGWDFIYF